MRKSLSSYVKPSLMFCHQLRGLVWLKLPSRMYSLNAAENKLIPIISAAAQP